MRGNWAFQAIRVGASLLETALAVGIMGMIMGSVAVQQGEQAQRDRAYLAADRTKEIQGWVTRFMDKSGESLSRTLPVGQTVAMAVLTGGLGQNPSLESLGFVPEGFQDNDSWGNQHVVLMRQSNPGSITALVVQTGGRKMSDKDLGNAMLRVGVVGGGIFAVPPPGARDSPDAILGTAGGWKLVASDWNAGGIQVTPGHIVARTSVSLGNQITHQSPPQQQDSTTSVPPLGVPVPDAPQPPTSMNME